MLFWSLRARSVFHRHRLGRSAEATTPLTPGGLQTGRDFNAISHQSLLESALLPTATQLHSSRLVHGLLWIAGSVALVLASATRLAGGPDTRCGPLHRNGLAKVVLIDSKLASWEAGCMKTPLQPLDELVREAKLCAVAQRRTLKDLVADCIRQGLGIARPVPSSASALGDRVLVEHNGLPTIRRHADAPATRANRQDLLALDQQAQTEENRRVAIELRIRRPGISGNHLGVGAGKHLHRHDRARAYASKFVRQHQQVLVATHQHRGQPGKGQRHERQIHRIAAFGHSGRWMGNLDGLGARQIIRQQFFLVLAGKPELGVRRDCSR